MKPATPPSRQMLLLIGAVLFAIAGRAYLSNGGAEAMVYQSPRLRSLSEAETLAGFAALAVAVSAAVAAAGKRWVGRISSVVLGGIGGLLAISHYNALLGAAIGLTVGLLIACGVFVRVLTALAMTVAALAIGVICGASALVTQRDLSGGPGAVVLLLMAATIVAAAMVLFRRAQKPFPAGRKSRWLRTLGRAGLFLLVIFGLWLSLSVDTVRRVHRLAYNYQYAPIAPEVQWFWRGCFKVKWLAARYEVTDDDLSDLRGFAGLAVLDLRNTRITDAGLAQLRDLPWLREVVLDGTEITGEGFKHLAALPALDTLSLQRTHLDSRQFERLRKLAVLQTLWLNETQLDDDALARIGTLTQLRSLSLSDANLTDQGLNLLQGLNGLNVLNLSATNVTDAGMPSLKQLKRLWYLDLAATRITDDGLNQLPVLPRLGVLRIDDTHVTDAGLLHLQKLPLLQRVSARETAVTDAGAENLCKAMRRPATMPKCEVQR